LGERHPEEFPGTERFQVRRGLGVGGFGAVYEVFDRSTGAILALKVLKRGDAPSLYRFKREFRALADVTHPNLVALYELVSEGGRWFFTMELVDGVDFLTHVWGAAGNGGARGLHTGTTLLEPPRAAATTVEQAAPTVVAPGRDVSALDTSGRPGGQVGPRPARVAPRLDPLRDALAQLTAGILALHGAGKLHCDIKPLNVRVTPEGRVVLLDFGLVSESTEPLPLDSGVVGTVPYMSPEQALGQPLIEASDWYSLGAMLYEALTGTVPFRGTVAEVLRAKQQSEPPPPSTLAEGTPRDLDEICHGLLRRDPARRLTGRDVLARLGHTSAPSPETGAVALVGRERHLRRLDQAFAVARGGRPAVAHVRGPSGMGKTALVRRFVERLRARGPVVVLSGRCFERESVPYKALDSLVDALAHHLRVLPADDVRSMLPREVAALVRLFPVLSQVPGLPSEGDEDNAGQSPELRRRGVTALRALVGRLARRVPLVLWIDDLHWGDVDSAVLLAELLAPPDPAPVLFVAGYRHGGPEPEGAFLRTFRSLLDRSHAATHVDTVDVAELTPPEGEALARALVREAPAGVPETIAREASGNALFITELARDWKGRGVLAPITLEAMIQARVARLPPEARCLLEVVAVAARPLPVEVAGAAAELGTAEQPALAQLRATYLVRFQGARAHLETAHDRIREVVVRGLGADALRAYHLRLATALQASGRADAEALAVHFQGAGDPERAATYAVEAAAQSSRALAFDRAARLYRLALELRGVRAVDDHLRVALADALANAGRGGEAAEAYLAAAAAAPEPTALELRRRAAEQFLRSGRIDPGLDAIRAVLGSLGMKLARTPRRALVSLVLRRAWLRLRGLGYRERAAADVPADELIRIDACWSVTVGLSLVDNVRAADFQARHLLRALRAGEPYRIARALALQSGHSAAGGTRAQVRTQWYVTEAARLADQLRHPHALGLVALMAGLTAFLEGRFRTAMERADEAARILRDRCTGVAQELDTAQSYALLALTYLGELAELARRLPALIQDAEDRGDLFGALRLRTRLQAVALLAADDPERAAVEVERAIAQWSHQAFHIPHYNAMWARATVALYAGDARGAMGLLAERARALRDSLTLRAQLVRIEVRYLRARCALSAAAQGDGDGRLMAQAADEARAIRREATGWADPLAALVEAGLAATQGDRTRALDLVDRAESGCESAQMGLCAAAARRRRGELLGGEAGQALVEAADAWMRQREIRNPARMTALFAPGRY
jgi:serine/threonine protein kinase